MILSILKIIGIVILIILAIILLLLGVVLFVPIRYRFSGEYKEKMNGNAKLIWVPVLLKAVVEMKENELSYTVRILGGVVMTNTGEKISWLGRKLFDDEAPNNQKKKEKHQKQSKKTSNKKNSDKSSGDEKSFDKKNASQKKTDESYFDKKNFDEKNFEEDEKATHNSFHKKKLEKKKKTQKEKKLLNEKVEQLKKKLHAMLEQIKEINKKKEALLKVYRSPRFGQAKKDVIKYIKSAFRLLKPDRLDGYVLFGTGDPASTGEIFGVLAMALPIYYRFLVLEPSFEDKILEAQLSGKGKLRLISIVILMIKVSLNKNLIKVIKRVQTIMNW